MRLSSGGLLFSVMTNVTRISDARGVRASLFVVFLLGSTAATPALSQEARQFGQADVGRQFSDHLAPVPKASTPPKVTKSKEAIADRAKSAKPSPALVATADVKDRTAAATPAAVTPDQSAKAQPETAPVAAPTLAAAAPAATIQPAQPSSVASPEIQPNTYYLFGGLAAAVLAILAGLAAVMGGRTPLQC